MNSKFFERAKSDDEKPEIMVGCSLKQTLHSQGEEE